MIETNRSDDVMADLLAAVPNFGALFDDGVPQVFELRAPSEGPSLYVVFQLVSSDDTNSLGGARVLSGASYQVEAVGRGVLFSRVKAVADAFDSHIAPKDGSASFVVQGGVYVGKFVRTNILSRSENYDNVWWYYIGGVYDTVVYEMVAAP